jgi:PAS domain S-box-containing protein
LSLDATRQELEDFLEHAPIAFHWMDADGIILGANRAALTLLGYERDEYVGSWFAHHQLDREVAEAVLDRVRAGEDVRDVELRLRRKDGSIVHARVDCNAPRREGSFGHARCYLRDIGPEKRATEAHDAFLNMLAHELRNPLAPLRTCLQILEQPSVTAAAAAESRRRMGRQLTHLSRLVDDLLDVSRLSTGRLVLRREPLDLAVVVREALDDHREMFASAGLELEVHMPERPLGMDGDRVRLAQALGNLLQNACKFSDPGGRVELTLETNGGGNHLLLLHDTGIGMTRELLGRLFQPFSQGDRSLDRSRGGLGLGLVLARRLVELHGGTVEADSAGEGRGSTFRVRLPASEPPATTATEGRRPGNGRSRRILVIEDHRDSADSLAELLRLKGHEVTVTRNGFSGLAHAHECRPHLVFCDLGLPGKLDGFEVARALRHDPELGSAVLVALTGYGGAEDQRRARDAGFDAHLTKPADPDTLERLLAGFSPILEGRTATPAN